MRIVCLTLTMAISTASLIGCSTPGHSPTQLASHAINRESVTLTTHDSYPAKNPQIVSLYDQKQKPHAAYRIIGVASVSRYNLFGAQRKDEVIQQMMKKLAASIGGDGIIDLNYQPQAVQAKIIAYQKILI